MTPAAIVTERLSLEPLDPHVIRLLLAGDRPAAEAAIGADLPEEFAGERSAWLRRHLELIERQPDRSGWCARLARVRAGGEVAGHCGFHGPSEAVGRAEIGYTVFEPYRRRGYGRELARALVDWGLAQGERLVYASVSPDNVASLAIIRGLGFRQVGVQEDPIDGTELVFAIGPG